MKAYTIPGIKTEEDIICDSFGIEKENLLKRRRWREVVEARYFLFWYQKTKLKHGISQIGRNSGFDHATVIHGFNTVNDLMQTDKIFREKAETAIRNLECIQK